MRPLSRAVTVVVATLLTLGALAVPASAASPMRVSSSPAADSVIRVAPNGVSVTFDQNVATSSTITVAAPAGTSPCNKDTMTAAARTVSCTFTGLPTATRNDGLYTVSYTANSTGTDPATTGGFTFRLDTVQPAAPTGLAVSPSPYLAASDTLTVTGTSESASDKVAVTLTGGASKTVDPAADRTFSATFSSAEVRAAADGTVTATATSTDTAGNVGAAASRTFTKDTVRPTVTSSTPASGGSSNLSPFVYNVTASEALTQTAPASTIRLFDSTGTELAATVTYPSTTTIRATPNGAVPEGAYTARVFLTDLNGNTNNPSPDVRPFTVDRTAPAAPTLATPLAVVNKANAASWPVSGTGEAGASLVVTAGSVTRTVTVGANGAWSTTLDLSAVADTTSLAVSTRQTDAGGNQSAAATGTTSKDTVAPVVTGAAVTPASFGGTTSTATVTGSVNDGGGPVPPAAAENTAVQVTADDADPATSPVVVNGTSPGGSFSIAVDTSTLRDGTITYRIVATDQPAGNPSTAVTVTNTRDTAAPAAPTVTFNPASINNATKASVTVSGSAGGTTVRVSLSDGNASHTIIQTATVSNGSYTSTFNTTGLDDGTITATVTTTDAAGNTSAAGAGTATKDTVAPAAPTNVVVPTYVTGGSLPVSGRAEAGSTIRVTVTDTTTPTARTATATVVVAADGTWSLTVDVSNLADGALSVAAVATDAAGNAGPATTVTTTKDTVTPDQPATVTATPTTYLPSSTTFTVSGTTSTGDRAATDLQAVIVVTDGSSPAKTLTATVAVTPGTSAGTFSQSFTAAQVATFADGPLTVSVTLKDAAGNTSAPRTTTATKDTTVLDVVSTSPMASPPAAPASMPASASVTFNEAITSPTSTPAATRSTISVTNRNGVTVAGSASVNGRTLTFTPSSPFTEAGGPFTVSYTAYDVNNTAETKSGSFQFSVDNTPPAAPVVTSVTNPVTQANQTMVVVNGTVESPGLPVRVTIADTIANTTTSGAGGAFSVTVDVTALADGTLAVAATVQDPSGNTSAAGTSSTRKDATSPTKVSSVPATGTTTTPPSTVRITFSEPLGTGSIAVPGVTGTSSVQGSTVVFTPAAPFADGTYTATASVTDSVGNPGSGATTFTVDGTAPAVPVITAVTNPVTLANQSNVRVAGTAEAGATITVRIGSVVTTTTSDANGSWNARLDVTALADGTLTVTATASDPLGNTSAASAPATTTKDTARPTLVSVVPADGSTVAPPATIRFTFSETLGSGTVSVTGVSGSSTISGSTVTFTPAAPLASGSYTATASVTDAVGNAQSGTPTTTFTVDGTGPAVTGLAATATNATTTRTTVSGTTEAGASVSVTVSDSATPAGTVTATTTADSQGAFSIQVQTSTLADGALTVRAVATDQLGNAGPAAQTTTTKDATAPTVNGLAATPTSSAQQSTTVTGTRSETSSVVVTATVGSQTVTGTVPSGSGAFSIALDLTGLGDGVVTVRAVASDAAGNTGAAAQTTTTRDATRPAVTGLAATATSGTQQTTTVTGTRSETSTVVVEVTDGTRSVVRTVAAGTGGFSVDLDLTQLGQGPLTVRATPTDTAGNVGATAQTTADRDVTGPTVTGLAATATNGSTTRTTVTGTTEAGASVTVTVADGATPAGTVTATVTAGPQGGFSVQVDTATLRDGTLTVRAVATDALGNAGPSAQTTTTKDATAPTVTGLAATPTTATQQSTTVTGTRSETSSVVVTATVGDQTVTGTVPSGSGAFNVVLDLTALGDGTVTVRAVATDAAGNAGPAAVATTTRDAGRPVVTDLAATATSTVRPITTVTGTRSEASSVTVEVSDGTRAVVGTVPTGTDAFSIDLDLTQLGQGPLTVRATATDAAGNVGPTAQTTADRDVTGPTVTDLAATATSTVRQTTTVTGTRSEPGSVAVSVSDGTRLVTGTVPSGSGAFSLTLDLTILGDGPLTVRANATDPVGNVGPIARATADRDVTAPTVTGLAATDTTRSSDVTTVTGTRSEAAGVALRATDGTRAVTAAVAAGTGSFSATLDLTGFTPGTVTVTATATDTAGNVGPAATTTLTHVGPPSASSTTLTVSSSRVVNGQPITLRGKVTRPGGGTSGQVRLSATTFRNQVLDLGPVALAADGTFSTTFKPGVNARYRATYAGDEANAGSASPVVQTVVVAKVTASSKPGKASAKAVVTGRVVAAANGTSVRLFRFKADGTATQVAQGTVSGGAFTLKAKLPKGNNLLEVRVASTPDNAAGAVRLRARRT